MNKTLRFFLFIAAYLFCRFAFADSSGASFTAPTGTVISPNDQSLYYLGLIFGQVGNVLTGTGTQVMGIMFGEFNRGVMILGTIVFTYIYGKGILDTAAHGEFLGKQTNSVWVPLRSVAGIALMIPNAVTGYSIIQVFMMWVVLQGVGVADMIWTKTVDYMQDPTHGGNNQSLQSITDTASIGTVNTTLNNVFQSMTCLRFFQAADVKHQGKIDIQYWPGSSPETTIPTNRLDPQQKGHGGGAFRGYTFDYVLSPTGGDSINCGSVYWETDTNVDPIMYAAQYAAVQNIISTFEPIGFYYVTQAMNRAGKTGKVQNAPPLSNYPSTLSDAPGQDVYNFAGTNFMRTSLDMYFTSVSNAIATAIPANSPDPSEHRETRDGWIYAGSYYYKLVSTSVSGMSQIPPIYSSTPDGNGTTNQYLGSDWQNMQPMGTAVNYASAVNNNYKASAPSFDPAGSNNNADTTDPTGGNRDTVPSDKLNNRFLGISITTMLAITAVMVATTATVGAGESKPALAAMTIGTATIMTAFITSISVIMTNLTSITLPLTSLSLVGHVILITVGISWLIALYAIFYAGVGENIMNCMNPVGYADTSLTSYISTMFYALLAVLLVIGAYLVVYLPLLPFIYFLFGTISWLIAVIETMIAAPIVALGIIHPEGHDLWGKAEPAVMLTVNVFLRPALMLFGLIAGMLLSFASIQLLTSGFSLAIGEGYGSWGNLVDPIAFFLYFALYVILVVVIVQTSFKLILEVPNRTLQWLGAQGQLGGNMEEATQAAKQQFGAASSDVQQGFKGSEHGAREEAREYQRQGNKNRNARRKESGLSVGAPSGAGGGGGGGGGGGAGAGRPSDGAAAADTSRRG